MELNSPNNKPTMKWPLALRTLRRSTTITAIVMAAWPLHMLTMSVELSSPYNKPHTLKRPLALRTLRRSTTITASLTSCSARHSEAK